MERLTKKVVHNNTETAVVGERMCVSICTDRDEYDCEGCPVQDALQKLAAYEDAEEAGLLIKLPVKVGETVWVIEDVYEGKKRTGSKAVAFTVDRFVIGENMTPVVMVCNENNNWVDLEDNEWGKTVFLTREEAEKALETANES